MDDQDRSLPGFDQAQAEVAATGERSQTSSPNLLWGILARPAQTLTYLRDQSQRTWLAPVILAILLVILVLPHFNQLAGKQLSLNPVKNLAVLIGLLAIAAFTGILSGSYPALLFSSFKPIAVLRESASSGAKNPMLRRILVVFQFTVATVLIIGSVTIQRQMNFIRT